MTVASKQDAKKWIQASVAVACILLGYIILSFINTLGEWFDLEAKIGHFDWVSQGVAVGISFLTFLIVITKENSSNYLTEVFAEAFKVVWPDRSQTVRMTFGIMVGVAIAGLVFWVFDLTASFLLNLVR
ncbi:MAG: preprotein translocase subunit SecE [Bacteriovoracaceae bacterium]|nr:preprotein translocase subunit SecE [Bacteriovoracaceae bacterium]